MLMLCAYFGVARVVSAAGPVTGETILYTVASQYRPLAWLHGGERFPFGAQIYIDDGQQARPLVPAFAATADASLSFDATEVFFSGKKLSGDPWQLWEMKLNNRNPRQLTDGPDDHVRPFYLPDARIVYARRHGGHFALEDATKDDSSEITSLSFAPGDYLPAGVLQDGRVLFSASHPLGSGNAPEIYTVYPDGSGVESYRCDHSVTRGRFAATQLRSGDIVFTHGRTLARFASPIAHEVSIAAPHGDYAGDIAETPNHDWIISSRLNATLPYALYSLSPGDPVLHPAASLITKLNLVQPVLVAPRIVPRRFPSALHEWSYANLLALDAYTSREPMPTATIHSVRAFTLNDAGQSQLLGSAPVQKDGSFFVQVPGNRPIRLELLNASGRIIRAEHGWMWARAGEQRICVGCHAGPEHAPENAVPQVLNVSSTPADLTGLRSSSGGR
jgi:hypothetical protein